MLAFSSSQPSPLTGWLPLQFQKHFIEKGIEGGKQAAYALRNAILKECYEYTGEIEVVARFIANLSGLAMITRASGTVDHEATVKEFTLGFTQGMASFDFIDVGKGKERADTKIKGKGYAGDEFLHRTSPY